jgi:hypothetical protein
MVILSFIILIKNLKMIILILKFNIFIKEKSNRIFFIEKSNCDYNVHKVCILFFCLHFRHLFIKFEDRLFLHSTKFTD